jgi:hypothetical protein
MSQEIEEANIHYLDHYLEIFYEDNIEAKIAATRKILILTLDMNNLEFLLNHGNNKYKLI